MPAFKLLDLIKLRTQLFSLYQLYRLLSFMSPDKLDLPSGRDLSFFGNDFWT